MVKIFSSFFVSRQLSGFQKFIRFCNWLCAFLLLLSYLSTWISPATFWPIAFFGLAYPLIIVLNLLFILYWLIYRNKWILISLLSILTGFNHLRHFFQISFGSGAALSETQQQIKIISWNVRVFDLYNESTRTATRDSIFAVLQREDPDIILFQEFYHTDRVGYFETRNILNNILRAKNYYEGYTHKLHHQQFFGLATFSAFPIVGQGEIKFDNDDNNNVIFTDLKINDDTIRVYNAHLSSIRFQRGDYDFIGDTSNSRKWIYPHQKVSHENQQIIARLKNAFIKRAEQSAIVKTHVQQSPYPVILGGDFNDTPVSYCYSVFNEILTDAFIESGSGTGATYIGKFPSFRIDYLWHNEAIHSYQYRTLPEELSDHHAISCMMEVVK